MAPVATSEHIEVASNSEKVFNPFYSPSIGDDGNDSYKWSQYKVRSHTFSQHVRDLIGCAVSPTSQMSPGRLCKK